MEGWSVVTTKNTLSLAGRVLLSVALLYYLFSRIDVEKTWGVLRTAQFGFLGYAGITFLGINGVLLLRWLVFIKALALASPVREVVRYYFIGLFGNIFLPSAIGGDLIKMYGLCRNNSQKTRVVASVILDRLSGFVAIILVSFAALILGYRLVQDSALFVPLAGVTACAGFFACVLFNEKIYSFCCCIFSLWPKIQGALMDLHYDLALMRGRRQQGLLAIGISCLSQVMYAVTWYLIARALGEGVSLICFLIFVPLTCIAASFPSIGGLGVREIGAVYLFGKVGMESGIAASISLINFILMVIVGLMGGIVYVFTLSSGRVQYHSSDVSSRASDTRRSASAID